MMTRVLLVVILPMTLLAGCGDMSSSDPTDMCNDQAWNECADIARRECGLSGSASQRDLQECKPFVRCDDAAFDACMDEHE